MSDSYSDWLQNELAEIRQEAVNEGNTFIIGRLDEAEAAANFPGEENLTGIELAQKLGVQPKEDGSYDFYELFNAAMGVQSNPLVQALPEQERLQVISTAMALLSR